jgi:hypothetical protein
MRIRLRAPCQIAGHVHAAGEIVILPDGVRGPHTTARKSHDRIDYSIDPAIDANRMLGEMEDVPLYDEVDENGNVVEHEQEPAHDHVSNLGERDHRGTQGGERLGPAGKRGVDPSQD